MQFSLTLSVGVNEEMIRGTIIEIKREFGITSEFSYELDKDLIFIETDYISLDDVVILYELEKRKVLDGFKKEVVNWLSGDDILSIIKKGATISTEAGDMLLSKVVKKLCRILISCKGI